MNVGQLLTILQEYPPSLRLDIVVGEGEGRVLRQTTVIEMCLKLMVQPPQTSLIYYGCTNCIVRERIDTRGGDAIIPPNRMWLELDLR